MYYELHSVIYEIQPDILIQAHYLDGEQRPLQRKREQLPFTSSYNEKRKRNMLDLQRFVWVATKSIIASPRYCHMQSMVFLMIFTSCWFGGVRLLM